MKAGETEEIEAIVKTINKHITNISLCYFGCGALWSMTLNGKKLIKQTH